MLSAARVLPRELCTSELYDYATFETGIPRSSRYERRICDAHTSRMNGP